MTLLLFALGCLAAINLALAVKVLLMRRAADEIRVGFAERLAQDTNVLIDISSRDRRMRALVEEINAQLRLLRAQRRRYQQGDLELKEAIANVSHDLRTPLTAIVGYAQLLEREALSPAARQCVGVIKERAGQLRDLTQSLFSFCVAASRQMRPERVSLGDAIGESTVAFYAALSQRGIVPDIDLPEMPVVRLLDRAALSRVLENLLSNAIKYSDGDLRVELSPEGRIQVSNRASGLDAVQAGRLFNRFYTVQTAGHSTGLGLHIARTLVEQMGGEIDARYEDERLTVSLSFPANI